MADDDQFEVGLDESGRYRLYTACPSGHPTIQAFTPGEWRDGLITGTLRFECLYCGARWEPTATVRGMIQSELES
jgi:hypothetical protein